jgi:hypothetical protein
VIYLTVWRARPRQLQALELPIIKGVSMPRAFVFTLGILLIASLVIVPKFVFSRSEHTKAENTQAETCDLIVAGSTRYVPPC